MCRFTEPPQCALSRVTIETKIFIYDRIVGWYRDMLVCRGASLRGRRGHELPQAGREAVSAVRGRLKSRWQNSRWARASLMRVSWPFFERGYWLPWSAPPSRVQRD